MALEIFELIAPTEENGYCVFAPELEEDEHVFFHMTPAENKDAIIENGFLSAEALGVGDLCSVSYAKNSSSCFANIGNFLDSEHVIFAVRFDPNALKEVVNNPSDIHVYKHHLQPEKLGIVYLPAGFALS